MQGLRTQEKNKFLKFFEIVQAEAKKLDAVFFLDCGQGKTFENEQIECEDLCGWLIPFEKAKDFDALFLGNSEQVHNFDDFYTSVDFFMDGDTVKVVVGDIDDIIFDKFKLEDIRDFWEYLEFYPEEDEEGYDGIHDGGIKGIKETAPNSAKKQFKEYQKKKDSAKKNNIKL